MPETTVVKAAMTKAAVTETAVAKAAMIFAAETAMAEMPEVAVRMEAPVVTPELAAHVIDFSARFRRNRDGNRAESGTDGDGKREKDLLQHVPSPQ